MKINFLSKEYQKQSLKQTMMIEKQHAFVRNISLLKYEYNVFDSR